MNNELFIVRPSLRQHYGRTVTKELSFDEKTESGEVHQTLQNCLLTTEINRTWENCGIKSTQHSIVTELLPEGTVLLWNETEGYIVPNVAVYKLKDLEEEIAQVKTIYADNTDMNPCEDNEN